MTLPPLTPLTFSIIYKMFSYIGRRLFLYKTIMNNLNVTIHLGYFAPNNPSEDFKGTL